MSPAAAAVRRPRRALARVAAACLLAACVTTVEEAPLFDAAPPPPPTVPAAVTIPFGDAGQGQQQRAVAEFHLSILRQLQEAAVDRDPRTGEHDVDRLAALIAGCRRDDLPADVKARVDGYRLVELGLRFCERHAARTARIELLPPEPAADGAAVPIEQGVAALGAPLRFELRLPAPAEAVGLGGADEADPTAFLVQASVRDAFVEGSERTGSTTTVVRLPEAFALANGRELRVPFVVDVPVGEAAQRDVQVRVSLLPGYVRIGGESAPVPQTLLATAVATQWPVGYGAVAKAPLTELQAALRNFEPRTFPRAWLAAAAVPAGADREAAIGLLLEQVRFGRADQAQVAMAALRRVTGEPLLVGDRDAWLAWSQSRR